ncbi:MAG: hypothetical protein RDU76_07360 [Candidatus Edwardsbacteria bacterium]|nr:hypothetical protein [Candidatus Edwardsbacteria bacterium]
MCLYRTAAIITTISTALINFSGCAHRQVISNDRQAEAIAGISSAKKGHRLTLTSREQKQIIGRDVALFGDTLIVYNQTADRMGQMLFCDLQSIKRKSRSIGIRDGIIIGSISLSAVATTGWLCTTGFFSEKEKLKLMLPIMVISGLTGGILGGTIGCILGGQETYIFPKEGKTIIQQ